MIVNMFNILYISIIFLSVMSMYLVRRWHRSLSLETQLHYLMWGIPCHANVVKGFPGTWSLDVGGVSLGSWLCASQDISYMTPYFPPSTMHSVSLNLHSGFLNESCFFCDAIAGLPLFSYIPWWGCQSSFVDITS